MDFSIPLHTNNGFFFLLTIKYAFSYFKKRLPYFPEFAEIVGHPEPERKKSVGIFEYILASMLNVCLEVF